MPKKIAQDKPSPHESLCDIVGLVNSLGYSYFDLSKCFFEAMGLEFDQDSQFSLFKLLGKDLFETKVCIDKTGEKKSQYKSGTIIFNLDAWKLSSKTKSTIKIGPECVSSAFIESRLICRKLLKICKFIRNNGQPLSLQP